MYPINPPIWQPSAPLLGVVSSYSSSGKLNWQVRKAPRWGDEFNGYLVRLPQDQEVLVSGEHNLMLLSASGHLRAEAQMPQVLYSSIVHFPDPPTPHTHRLNVFPERILILFAQPPRRRPILGDFDGDGAADVLVVSDDAIWGYSLQYVPGGGGAFRLIVTVLVLAIVGTFFSNLQIDDGHIEKGKYVKKSAHLHRSTD